MEKAQYSFYRDVKASLIDQHSKTKENLLESNK